MSAPKQPKKRVSTKKSALSRQFKQQSEHIEKTTKFSPKVNFEVDFIDLKFIGVITHELARALLPYDEPIPAFATRYEHKLESCLSVIDQPEYYNDDPVLQFANLLYRLVKNHPFQNGNKRIAMTTLLVVININTAAQISLEPYSDYHMQRLVREIKNLGGQDGSLASMFLKIARSSPKEKETCVTVLYKLIVIMTRLDIDAQPMLKR